MGEYTREEEIALFAAAQAGDRGSVAELMRRHEKLVHCIVQRQWSGGWRYADVVHEGRIGLWQAILHYDPGRGTQFSTYAGWAIAHQVWTAVAAGVEQPGPGALAGSATAVDLQEHVVAKRIGQVLRGMVASLPLREAWVVQHYYGLGGRARRLYSSRALWKQHYGSSRNSQLEHLGLKRIWSYGLSGATADITFADLLINLRTLGRLVQQATLLDPWVTGCC